VGTIEPTCTSTCTSTSLTEDECNTKHRTGGYGVHGSLMASSAARCMGGGQIALSHGGRMADQSGDEEGDANARPTMLGSAVATREHAVRHEKAGQRQSNGKGRVCAFVHMCIFVHSRCMLLVLF